MSTTLSTTLSIVPPGLEAPGSDGRQPPRQNPRRRDAQAEAAQAEAQETADPGQRLIIQEVGDTGEFIYTVINRANGEIVAKSSREEVAQMGQKPDYAAGSLIRTSV
jgi:hypothetical protein